MRKNLDSFILLSEKNLLAARYYSLDQDPFVGIIEGRLKPFINTKCLSESYKKLVFSRTSLQLIFEKKETKFIKKFQGSAFKNLKEFEDKEAFLIWKNKTLDFETGPLHEMAIYKTLFKKTLCFKFHHLILDGFSLFIFFKELTNIYNFLKKNTCFNISNDFEVYKKMMNDFLKEENKDKEKKYLFWNQTLKSWRNEKNDAFSLKESLKNKAIENKYIEKDNEFSFQTANSLSFFIKRNLLKKIYKFQINENIGLFYLFASLYFKTLQENLNIDKVCIRIPFSARYHLKLDEQKNLMASLSRSIPLFINQPIKSIKPLVLELQKQARSLRQHVIIDSSPWKGEELNSFSKTKNQDISLAMSYFPYSEKKFFGKIQNFYWQKSFLDLTLFIILSEKRILLNFSYNTELFSKKEIINLSENFQKEIEKI